MGMVLLYPAHTLPIAILLTTRSNSLERYKARLVARGFQQEHGHDFDETFARVAHMTAVHTLLSVASAHQLDIMFQL